MPDDHVAAAVVERVFRADYGRAIATVVRLLGDIGLAEEAVQDAFAIALERWPSEGVPPSPTGWIVTTARNRAIDRVRREATRLDRYAQAAMLRHPDQSDEEVRPRDFGLKHAEVEDLQGGDAKVNAIILEAILAGRETGPKRDMVLMNSGAALACAGLADDMGDGIEISREMIASGAALEKLRLLQKASQA